jgi:hypothetical protein
MDGSVQEESEGQEPNDEADQARDQPKGHGRLCRRQAVC